MSPSQAAYLLPEREAPTSVVLVAMAEDAISPWPGMVTGRRASALASAPGRFIAPRLEIAELNGQQVERGRRGRRG